MTKKYGLYKCDILIYRVYDDVSDREYYYESDPDWNGVYKHEVELTYCEPLNEYNPIKQYYNDENKKTVIHTRKISTIIKIQL